MPKNNSINRDKVIKGIAIGTVAALIMILIFIIGIKIGRHGRFLPFWPERSFYPQNMSHGQKVNRHGLVGTIDSVGDKTLIIKPRIGDQKTVFVDDNTAFRQDWASINFSDLKVGQRIIVLGNPRDNAIDARAIRVIENHGKNFTR